MPELKVIWHIRLGIELSPMEGLKMIQSIAGIRFKGAAFSNQTTFEPFIFTNDQGKRQPKRICLAYGKNGSGKSTISRAIISASGSELPEIVSAELLDANGKSIVLSKEQANNVMVFNEDYTRRNVQLREDGLSTIVMFGGMGDLTIKIEEATTVYKKAQENEEIQAKVKRRYEDSSDVLSPKKYLNQIQTLLKGDANWAGREREIKGTKQNAPVGVDSYKQFVQSQPKQSKAELEKSYKEKLIGLQKARSGASTIETKVQTTFALNYDEATVISQLAAEIENPVLSEREQFLLTLAQAGKNDRLEEIKSTFSNDNVDICPFCLQKIDVKQKQFLIEGIAKVLSKAVDEHKNELRTLTIPEISISFEPFSALNEKTIEQCKSKLELLNTAIQESNQRVEEKIQNVYTPIVKINFGIKPRYDDFIAAMKALEQSRIEYNKKISNTTPLVTELAQINASLAYYEIIDAYTTFLKQDKEYKMETEKWNALSELTGAAKDELDRLEATKKNIKVARDVINDSLQYVFFSPNRLSIEIENDVYTLRSNGKNVKPANVSVGERNIISLCYFFASIMMNREPDKAYSEEFLIVIDDPISSFDLENRVGIMSFLKSQLSKYLCGNDNSKLLLMTHDLPSFFDFEKMIGEIMKSFKNGNGSDNGYNLCELTYQNLLDFKYKKRHEYTTLIEDIYRYANGDVSDIEPVIGNMMRRALEAFSTFEYKKGIEDISLDHDILSSMGNSEYEKYFENLMYRLILNGASHNEESVRSLTDINFYDVISTEEKQRTAKDILCLINALNSKHLKAHLSAISGAIESVDKWCENIKAPA